MSKMEDQNITGLQNANRRNIKANKNALTNT